MESDKLYWHLIVKNFLKLLNLYIKLIGKYSRASFWTISHIMSYHDTLNILGYNVMGSTYKEAYRLQFCQHRFESLDFINCGRVCRI